MRFTSVAVFLVLSLPLCAVAGDLFTISGYDATGPFGGTATSLSGNSYVFGLSNGQVSSLTEDSSQIPNGRSPGGQIQLYTDDYANPGISYDLNFSASETLSTSGPIRQGVIEYDLSTAAYSLHESLYGYPANVNSQAEAGISDGVHAYTQNGCTSTCDTGLVRAPFTLGTIFTALSYADQSGYEEIPLGGSLYADSQVTFELFEADGVTPVPILETPDSTPEVPIEFAPEPGTWATCGFTLIVTLLGTGLLRRCPSGSVFASNK